MKRLPRCGHLWSYRAYPKHHRCRIHRGFEPWVCWQYNSNVWALGSFILNILLWIVFEISFEHGRECWIHCTHFGLISHFGVLQLLGGAFLSDADHRRATSGWRRATGTKGQIPQFISVRDHTRTERNRRAQVGPQWAKDTAARNSTKQHLLAFSRL